jgi:EmrB/QacA subfamily drug resistance transporter
VTTADTKLDPHLLKLALILVLGALAPLLDSTIVNVALHTLGHDLHTTVATVQWVTTGYLLALTLAIPATGWAIDRYGAKHLWLTALLLFAAGSILAGAAWNIDSLIAFRVLQGIGGGLLLPVLQTVLMRAAGGRHLGRLMAVITLPALAGPILGPVVGGLIAGHLSWRWIFYVNIPLCAIAIALAWRHLPTDQPTRHHRLDTTGLTLLCPGLVAIVYGLTQVGTTRTWTNPTVWLPLLIGTALLAAFTRHALHTDHPLIDLHLFTDRAFTASAALLFLAGFATFGAMLLLPLYYQQVHGADVVTAGLLLVPQGIGSLLARGIGSLTDHIGPRPVILAGILATTAGTLPFTLTAPDTWLLAAALVIRGLGLSATNMAIMVGAYQGLDRARIPHASSTTRIMQQLGGSFGTAVLAVLLAAHLATRSTAVAFGQTFWWAVAFSVLALVPALLLPKARNSVPTDATVANSPSS